MKTEKLYKKWKIHRCDQRVPDNFSARIMEKLEIAEPLELFYLDFLFLKMPLFMKKTLQTIATMGLAFVGIYRTAYLMITILTP